MKTMGIDLGGTKIRVAMIENGTILRLHSIPTKKERPFESIWQDLIQAMESFEDLSLVERIGICVCGPVDSNGLVLECGNLPGLVGFPIQAQLEQRFHKPVAVLNDGDAACLSEAKLGSGKGKRIVVYTTVSTGLGGGICLDGNLYAGANGYGAEFSDIPLPTADGSPFIRAGLCCGEDLLHFAQKISPELKTSEEVFQQAAEDPRLNQLIQQLTEGLIQFYRILIAVLDPDVFVLGGSLILQQPKLLHAIQTEFAASKKKLFVPAALEEPGVLGAAEYTIERGTYANH